MKKDPEKFETAIHEAAHFVMGLYNHDGEPSFPKPTLISIKEELTSSGGWRGGTVHGLAYYETIE